MTIEINPDGPVKIDGNWKHARVSESVAEKHPEIVKSVSRHQLTYSLVGLFLGFICVIGGVALFLLGVSQKSQWVTNLLGASSEITDAAPGAILFIVGLFVVFVTRYQMHVANRKG